MMKEIPRISEAEWEVMKVIWSKGNCTSSEIVEVLEESTEWKPKTIKTLISRLTAKGVLGFEECGKAYMYYPIIKEDECIRIENQSFLQRVYSGALKNLLINFIEENHLSKEDIDELKQILEEREKEK